MKLPNQRDIVLGDIFVGADEGDLFVKGGCDKKTVKRVSVNHWERFINGKISGFNREKDKTVRFNIVDKISCISVNIQFSYVQFNCNFPADIILRCIWLESGRIISLAVLERALSPLKYQIAV